MTEPQDQPRTAEGPTTREYLRANLFDGDEDGRLTVDLAGWLGELSSVVDDLIRLRETAAAADALRRLRADVERAEPTGDAGFYDDRWVNRADILALIDAAAIPAPVEPAPDWDFVGHQRAYPGSVGPLGWQGAAAQPAPHEGGKGQ